MNAAEAIERNAFKFPMKIAVKDSKSSLTYSELNERVNALANFLIEMGISKGDKIALLFTNCVEFVEVHLATQKIGAVSVPLNTRLSAAELDYIVNDSDAKILFYDDEFEEMIYLIRKKLKKIKHFISKYSNTRENTVSFEEISRSIPKLPQKIDVCGDDESVLMYTSGTTGRPKGVILTHMNTIWNTLCFLIAEPFYPTDVTLIVAPLFHPGALNSLLFTHLFIGGTSVLMRKFDPLAVMETISKEQITNSFFVPTMFNALLKLENLNRYDISKFRLFINGGAILPVEQKRSLLKRFSSSGFIDVYGLTEVGPIATVLCQADSLVKTESVGKILVTLQARVVADDGSDVKPGVPGELVLKGPQVTKGYYKDAKKTADTIKEGWLYTGDIVRRDEEGFIYIVDRKKDMIITGGENVYPAEVEAVLYKHPKIYEAAVVGFPDEKWGERVKAYIVLKPGEKVLDTEIMEFCKKYIASYKKPTVIEFVRELPRTASGKVIKSQLRNK